MGKYEAKTRETDASVDAFLDAVPEPGRREDARKVRAMMERISGYPARLWGPNIVGFGRYHYRYASGHEGESARIGFSPRDKELVIYLLEDIPGHEPLMGRLGKYRTGRSCLYVRRLADVDEAVLEQIIAESLAHVAAKHPDHA